MIEVDPVDFETEPPDTPRPRPHFEPAAPSPDDETLLDRAQRTPGLRRIVKATRLPLGADDPAKVVYTAEYGAAADLIGLRASLTQRLGGPHVEVVAEGKDLPPYQASVLAAGTPIWPGPGRWGRAHPTPSNALLGASGPGCCCRDGLSAGVTVAGPGGEEGSEVAQDGVEGQVPGGKHRGRSWHT